MKDRRGFGLVGLFSIILVIGVICGAGWYVYSHRKQGQETATTQEAQVAAYKFTPVAIDTTKWGVFEPFQGFTLKHPTDWEIKDSGDFTTRNQRVTGLISDERTVDVTSKVMYLFSPDLTTTTAAKDDGDVNKGARFRLFMTLREAGSPVKSAEEYCANGRGRTEVIKVGSSYVCQKRISSDNGIDDYGYTFVNETNKVHYLLQFNFSPTTSATDKDNYTSIVREIVKSYQLY